MTERHRIEWLTGAWWFNWDAIECEYIRAMFEGRKPIMKPEWRKYIPDPRNINHGS